MYYCYHVCPTEQYNPTLGDSSSSCDTCPLGKTSIEGSTYCPNWLVTTMTELFNKVSNHASSTYNTGNNIMTNGDVVMVAVASYKYDEIESNCASSKNMIAITSLYGSISCINDAANCILDGELARRVMNVRGTGGHKYILRSLTYKDGQGIAGGGVLIQNGALVDVVLCIFSNCKSTSSDYGGGAIYLQVGTTTVIVFGTSFAGNTADSGNGNDIMNGSTHPGTIIIRATCPSPYTGNSPTQGEARIMRRIVPYIFVALNIQKLISFSHNPTNPPSFSQAVLSTRTAWKASSISTPTLVVPCVLLATAAIHPQLPVLLSPASLPAYITIMLQTVSSTVSMVGTLVARLVTVPAPHATRGTAATAARRPARALLLRTATRTAQMASFTASMVGTSVARLAIVRATHATRGTAALTARLPVIAAL